MQQTSKKCFGLTSRDTFQKFSHDYQHKYQFPQEYEQQNPQEKLRNELPNTKVSGDTWDAKHLDKFIQNNSYSSQQIYHNYNNEQIQEKQLYMNIKSNQHYTRTYSLPKFYSQINQNLIDKNIKQDPKQHYQRVFNVNEKNFDSDKLISTVNPNIINSKQQQTNFKDQLKNIQNYKEWVQNFNQASKSLKVHKQWHKSGILQVDNPELPNSCLYQKESQKFHNNQKVQLVKQKIQKDYLSKRQSCNKDIEFYNQNQTNNQEPQITHYAQNWQTKNRELNGACDSKERIFGIFNIPYKTERAEKLFKQQHKEVKYNIITQGILDQRHGVQN